MRTVIILVSLLVFRLPVLASITETPPKTPDLQKKYVICLHGAIVTGSNERPVSPLFGRYEYRVILEQFERDGFAVISEIRRDDSSLPANVQRVIEWISTLKKAGVPSRQISVVGASMGGIIAARVSASLLDPEVSYVLLASLYEMSSEPVVALNGRVLSIHDESDNHRMIPDQYFARSPKLAESRTVTTKTGLGHGLLYTPHAAWYDPAVEWISKAKKPNQ